MTPFHSTLISLIISLQCVKLGGQKTIYLAFTFSNAPSLDWSLEMSIVWFDCALDKSGSHLTTSRIKSCVPPFPVIAFPFQCSTFGRQAVFPLKINLAPVQMQMGNNLVLSTGSCITVPWLTYLSCDWQGGREKALITFWSTVWTEQGTSALELLFDSCSPWPANYCRNTGD